MKRYALLLIKIILFANTAISQDIEAIKEAKPFQWSGAIGTSLMSQPSRSALSSDRSLQYGIFGNLNMSFYETFELPLSFNYTQSGLSVDKPFYQLGLSPRYKWLQLHLGHRNMFFSNYTLAGHTFLGAGIELNPGKFRFAAMTGRLKEPLLIDALSGQELMNPQFRRTGWGVKTGVGSASNYVDVMLFKASDDAESISNWQDSIYQNSISGLTGRFAPEENLILGINARFTMFSKVILSIESGGSFFTADQSSDVIEGNFGPITPRTTSTFKYALKSSLSFPIGPLSLSTTYERVQPDYFSHGTYNMINDIENITIAPSGSFFKGRFSFSGVFGNSRNNLMNTRSETSKRLITNINALIAPKGHFGLNLNYSNFAFNQQAQAIVLNDSVLIRQVNTSFTLMPYYNILRTEGDLHSINAAFIRQEVDDLNPVTRDFGSLLTNMINANYAFTSHKGYQLSFGINQTMIDGALLTTTLAGIQIGTGYTIASSGLNVNLNSQLSSSKINQENDGLVANTSLSASLPFQKKHNFRTNFNWLKTNSKKFESYNDLIFQLSYTYTFR
jgi:hypothetical protein